MTSGVAGSIPLIEISSSSHLVDEVNAACRDIGFMYVRGHGISPRLIGDVRSAVIGFFSRPLVEKLQYRISRDNYRGYIPSGFFSPNSGDAQSDNYEGYKLHFEVSADNPICNSCELYGPNKWPDRLETFKKSLLAYWRECDRVAAVLLGAMAEALGSDRNGLLKSFESPLTNMTLLHYPVQDTNSSGFGIHPHKDTDALTILAPDPVGGLMARRRDSDDWIDAAPPEGALIVNIGDLMELWSGGYFVSTPHKVVNTSGAERYSFPYFAVPRFDTVVEPLRTPLAGFDRSSVHVGDVSKEVWRTNWPYTVSDKPHFDLGTLEN